MPQGFFYQANARPDIIDDDTDVFFDTVNSVPQENRHDYHVWPFSAIPGTIDTQFGSDDNCFSQDIDQLPQENLKPYEQWPFAAIQSEVFESLDTDVFSDQWNVVPQENRKEYFVFPERAIDGNIAFGETDMFADTFQVAQQNTPIEFWNDATFIEGEVGEGSLVDSDVFAITYERSNVNDRQEYFVWPFGSLDGGVSDGTEIVDSDTFSDTFQLDSACRVDVFMWPERWLDGNVSFQDTDCFADTFQLPILNRVDEPVWTHTFCEQATVEIAVDSTCFMWLYDSPQENRRDEFMRDVSSAGPNAFEDDASWYVFADTFCPLPQENAKPYEEWYFSATCDMSTATFDSDVFSETYETPQRNRVDDHEWPVGTVADMTTDDPSFYVFTDTSQLPQENIRSEHEFPAESSGPNTSEDDASYAVYFDSANTRPVETIKPYEQWPTSAQGDATETDPATHIWSETFETAQENRRDQHAWPFVFATDPSSDDPASMIFTRMVDELPITCRQDQPLWPLSAQGDASETDPSAFVFSSTSDLAQTNTPLEFMVRSSAEADSSEDDTDYLAFADTLRLPQENRRDEHAWQVSQQPVASDDTAGDVFFDSGPLPQESTKAYFAFPLCTFEPSTVSDETGDAPSFDTFAVPQQNRVDVHAWPFSAAGDSSSDDVTTGYQAFFDTFGLPQEMVKRYDQFPFGSLVDHVYTALIIGAYSEVVSSFVPGVQVQDAYTSICVRQDSWVSNDADDSH